MHDPNDHHDVSERCSFIHQSVTIHCMVYFKHEDWRQNDEDEVKCKPGQIQPLISKEIGRLLIDIRILIWPLKNGIAELLISNKDDHRCHVGIENDCLHEDPEIEGTTWLLTHFMSNTTTTALE